MRSCLMLMLMNGRLELLLLKYGFMKFFLAPSDEWYSVKCGLLVMWTDSTGCC